MKGFYEEVKQLCGRKINIKSTMKKILTLLLSSTCSFAVFAQNSVTSDPHGTQSIQKIIGLGSAQFSDGFTFSRISELVNSGTAPSTQAAMGIYAVASNSSLANVGIRGYSAGSASRNLGVEGIANGTTTGSNIGGFFSASNSSGRNYGSNSEVNTAVASSYPQFGTYVTASANTSDKTYGVYSFADNYGSGETAAGYFITASFLQNSGTKYGVYASASSGSGYTYGSYNVSQGNGNNVGMYAKASGGTTNYAAVLQSNSDLTSVQLALEETDNDYARISFKNINGEGWHQAAYLGTTAANSLLNFYYVPNAVDVLSLKGNGNATLVGTLTQSSDFRLKKNIQPITNVSQKINQMRGVYFDWKDENHSQNQQIGFIAQEVEKVFPQLVETDIKGYKSVAYANMTAVLVEALKEQNKRIEYLEKELLQIKSLLKNSQNIESK